MKGKISHLEFQRGEFGEKHCIKLSITTVEMYSITS